MYLSFFACFLTSRLIMGSFWPRNVSNKSFLVFYMPLLQQIPTGQMFKMRIVVLHVNYMYMYTRHMKDTRVTQLLCQHVFDSLYCSFCSLKFWNDFCLKIITNKITETKFSCPLGRTTKFPFSPAQEQLKLTAPGNQAHFFLALPAKTTYVSSFTNSFSCILREKKINIFSDGFYLYHITTN